MPRLATLLAATCAAVLLASSCTKDKPDPNYSSVTPTPSSSTTAPTPTESPSPTGFPTTGPNVSPGEVAPTEPVAATEDTTAGALAYAGFYLKSLDWAFATETSTFLQTFYAPNCTTCQSRLTYLQNLFGAGKHIEGGRLTIKKQEVVKNDGRLGAVMAVSTAVSVGAVRVLESSGATATSDPGLAFISLTTWLTRDGSDWQIVEERYA